MRRACQQLPSALSSPHKQDSLPEATCSHGQKNRRARNTIPACGGSSRRRRGQPSRTPWGRSSTGSFVPWICPTSPLETPHLGMAVEGRGAKHCTAGKSPRAVVVQCRPHFLLLLPSFHLQPCQPLSPRVSLFFSSPLSQHPSSGQPRGCFQCPDSPDLLAKLFSIGIFFIIPIFWGGSSFTKLEEGKCDLFPQQLGQPARLGTS